MADKDLEKVAAAGALATTARPDFIEASDMGTTDIDRDDIKLPRLAIAQGLSPQMIPGDPAHIPGLTLFSFFNDLTGQVYRKFEPGVKPLQFVICRRDVRFIEFDPNDRKVPLDLDVPRNDPRTKWVNAATPGEKGTPPRATKFVEFVVLLLEGDAPPEPVVISIQETNKWNKKAHERLSGFIKMTQPPAPIYAKIYSVTPTTAQNDKGTFGVFQSNQVGFIQDANLYKIAKGFSESLVGKTIDVTRQPGDDDFDTDAMDGNTSGM